MRDTCGPPQLSPARVHTPHYDPQSPVTPLTPDELQALDLLLQRLQSDQAMSLDGMDGYLTAFAIGPAALRALPGDAWLPAIWGGDDISTTDGATGSTTSGAANDAAPFSSKRQRKNTVVMALRHLRHLVQQFDTAPEQWEPIFSIAEQGADEWTDAREWCMGFLQAVDLMPSAWGSVWTDPALASALRPLLLLGGGLDGVPLQAGADENTEDLACCDALSRAVPEAVLSLRRELAS